MPTTTVRSLRRVWTWINTSGNLGPFYCRTNNPGSTTERRALRNGFLLAESIQQNDSWQLVAVAISVKILLRIKKNMANLIASISIAAWYFYTKKNPLYKTSLVGQHSNLPLGFIPSKPRPLQVFFLTKPRFFKRPWASWPGTFEDYLPPRATQNQKHPLRSQEVSIKYITRLKKIVRT